MIDSDNESLLEGDDYYTFLNIGKDATDEEIINQYRRLSKLYHPDKHQNPERKKEAEILFSKTKKAYEVLSDPHQRAIYDSLGVAGLATQGWEVVHRTKTPQEIREEYERLAREREAQRLHQQTNPRSSVSMTINATELFNESDPEDMRLPDIRDMFGFPHIEISSMSLSQSIEAPLTNKYTAILGGQLGSQNGRGNGVMTCSIRRVLSEESWAELEIGAGSGMQFGLKYFRSLFKGCSGNAVIQSAISPNGLKFGSVLTIANQLDQHTVGALSWKVGLGSGMTTSISRTTNRLNFNANLHFGIPSSHISASYLHKIPEYDANLKLFVKYGNLQSSLEFSAEKKVSQHSLLMGTMCIGIPQGVLLRLRLRRATQVYTCNVALCDEILPAPIIYGSVLPLIGWLTIDKLFIQPYLQEQKRLNLAKKKEFNKEKLAKARQEALSAVLLMTETCKRIVEYEENKKGVVILNAMYGILVLGQNSEINSEDSDLLDVTIALQCLVKDSKLILQEASKSQLPGFYDPSPGEEKTLTVKYLFHAAVHKVTIKDSEGLRIPKQSHRVDT